jgi:hypothetical protein
MYGFYSNKNFPEFWESVGVPAPPDPLSLKSGRARLSFPVAPRVFKILFFQNNNKLHVYVIFYDFLCLLKAFFL